MHYIQVNIGRNVASTPMSDQRWSEFKQDVAEHLAEFLAAAEGSDVVYPLLKRVECHEGIGTWDGVTEQSAHLSILVDVARFEGPSAAVLVTELRSNLREVGRQFEQDEIGFISGTRNIKVPQLTH